MFDWIDWDAFCRGYTVVSVVGLVVLSIVMSAGHVLR
jgi:hypothetical protein